MSSVACRCHVEGIRRHENNAESCVVSRPCERGSANAREARGLRRADQARGAPEAAGRAVEQRVWIEMHHLGGATNDACTAARGWQHDDTPKQHRPAIGNDARGAPRLAAAARHQADCDSDQQVEVTPVVGVDEQPGERVGGQSRLGNEMQSLCFGRLQRVSEAEHQQ